MIKSESESVPSKGQNIKPYPKLMINVSSCNGMVVLFEKVGKGVVVAPYDGLWRIGEYREDWAASQFVDFNNSIILTNE